MTQRLRPSRNGGKQNQLRIIAGKWRSRLLTFPDVDGLRPTGDRVRETLFNWLGTDIAATRCLDAFAGSGALGFEALSRGAKEVVFVEKDRRAFDHLKLNCQRLAAAGAILVEDDLIHWLVANDPAPFDLIFLDPPFSSGLLQQALTTILELGLLAPLGLVYIESPADAVISLEGWRSVRGKTSGAVRFQLFASN